MNNAVIELSYVVAGDMNNAAIGFSCVVAGDMNNVVIGVSYVAAGDMHNVVIGVSYVAAGNINDFALYVFTSIRSCMICLDLCPFDKLAFDVANLHRLRRSAEISWALVPPSPPRLGEQITDEFVHCIYFVSSFF